MKSNYTLTLLFSYHLVTIYSLRKNFSWFLFILSRDIFELLAPLLHIFLNPSIQYPLYSFMCSFSHWIPSRISLQCRFQMLLIHLVWHMMPLGSCPGFWWRMRLGSYLQETGLFSWGHMMYPHRLYILMLPLWIRHNRENVFSSFLI